VYDDGSGAGPALYAAGQFTNAGGQPAGRIAKWDGASWSPLGSGINGTVYALAVYDDGSGAGPALIAGGTFAAAGGQAANFIARWDGQAWGTLGTGMNFSVRALAVFDDGSGPGLYAGGQFTSAGAVSANRIARWDGQAWSTLAGGLNDDVLALAVFDEGSGNGPALYAGGELTLADGLSANYAARWDGQAWSALGGGLGKPVHALIEFDDGSGYAAALYAGGPFEVSPAGDSYLARWRCPPVAALSGCFGNPAVLTALDSTAPLGGTFDVSLSAQAFDAGLALLYFGFDGTDAAGCGLPVPNLGELLLSTSLGPFPVGSAHLIAGSVGFHLPVPAVPALLGVEVAFQGFLVGLFEPGLPIEFTNGLWVKLTQ
jgi:hypothetical protein